MITLGIIPARMASTRYPGKPMAKILGIPMIGHVYARCKLSRQLNDLYVATCDREIHDYIVGIGGKAVMTADTHVRCTERVSEALLKIEDKERIRPDVVVMIQGDEPMTVPSMIDASLQPFHADASLQVVNLMSRLGNREEHEDPNEIKVVVDLSGNALYFSREPIPTLKKGAKKIPMLKQVCVIPFRRDFLLKFDALPPTPLEEIESVDMLRVLEHGYKVRMVEIPDISYSVDTPEDLREVEKAMKDDPYLAQYRHLTTRS